MLRMHSGLNREVISERSTVHKWFDYVPIRSMYRFCEFDLPCIVFVCILFCVPHLLLQNVPDNFTCACEPGFTGALCDLALPAVSSASSAAVVGGAVGGVVSVVVVIAVLAVLLIAVVLYTRRSTSKTS